MQKSKLVGNWLLLVQNWTQKIHQDSLINLHSSQTWHFNKNINLCGHLYSCAKLGRCGPQICQSPSPQHAQLHYATIYVCWRGQTDTDIFFSTNAYKVLINVKIYILNLKNFMMGIWSRASSLSQYPWMIYKNWYHNKIYPY